MLKLLVCTICWIPVIFGQPAAEPKVLKDGTTKVGSLESSIVVTVANLPAWRKLRRDAGKDDTRLVLYLDDRSIVKSFAGFGQESGSAGTVRFDLSFQNAPDAWSALLKRPKLDDLKIPLSVGPEDGTQWPTEVTDFQLERIHLPFLLAWLALFVLTGYCFVRLARNTDLLLDDGQLPPGAPVGTRKSYSLARVQMAWWTFLVAGSFAFIFLVTWQDNSVSQSVLVLLGISSVTGLAAVAIDAGKDDTTTTKISALELEEAKLAALGAAATAEQTQRLAQVRAELATLACAGLAPATSGFWMDIVSDANGVSFHRFQMVLWTIVLGIVFLTKVGNQLKMPDFDTTLLTLMGISSGTYLGFKFPEKKGA